MPCLPLGDVPSNRFGIAAGRRKDTPSIGQIDGDQAVRDWQQVVQNDGLGRGVALAARPLIGDLDRRKFGRLALAKAELHAPAEEHAGGNVVAAAHGCGIGAGLF